MSKIKLALIIVIGAIAISAAFIIGMFGVKNTAIRYEETVESAKSDINVQEKRRQDLIGNLVDCVKEYDKHEYETIKAIADSRKNDDAKAEEVTTMIKAVSEAYPELKSNSNYKNLMNELSTTENLIANHRSNYNKQIRKYKGYVRNIPNSPILSFLGYEVKEYKYLDYENASEDAPTNLFGDK
ncbi:MAG: LemA family protein [Clostridium sp.]|nr:LemA family protein [Clostridium sp.]